MRKIVFSHHRAVGDTIMFTAGVRDFKLLFPGIEVNVESSFPELWLYNPYLTADIKKDQPEVEFYKVGYPIINNANSANTHFTQGFLFDMIAAADHHKPLGMAVGEFCAAFANGCVGDPYMGETKEKHEAKEPFISLQKKYNGFCNKFARIRGDLHMSREEINNNIIKEAYDVDRYWVIAPGGKRDCTAKIWDWRRFQKVIDHFDGLIKFVVIGRSDHLVENLDNVIDLTDAFKNKLRSLLSLVYHSEGFVSGVSMLMHLAAALPYRNLKRWGVSKKPGVVIYGGREPITFTCYNEHQILHTMGSLSCCDMGGCWHSRVVPLQKDKDLNRRLCENPVQNCGKTIQACMNPITSEDVIRAISIYYEGNLYDLEAKTHLRTCKPIEIVRSNIEIVKHNRPINILASLKSKGGGERSAIKIYKMLCDNGWDAKLYSWGSVHSTFNGIKVEPKPFFNQTHPNSDFAYRDNVPLLFYANDQIWDFCNHGQELIDKSSAVVVGINFSNGTLPKWTYPAKQGKLKAVIFQNTEKRDEFIRSSIGYDGVELITLFGAIELEKFIDVLPPSRSGLEPLVVLKHGLPDYRKYVTRESAGGGDKKHLWQNNFVKEVDVDFYNRLLKDLRNVRFEFMEAHPEVVDSFANEPRMKFWKFDEIPVEVFLSRGHVYLHRMSNKWRDQYPRVVAEALAAGLPVITEPRDGTFDRVRHGETGFHCVHYDEYLLALKTLIRKENTRIAMGMYAKDWARQNLNPIEWVKTLNRLL